MRTRLPIPKLAASPVQMLQTDPKFLNTLLQKKQQTWPQDVLYLRDTYDEVYHVWQKYQDPEQDSQLYKETAPKLEELVLGLRDISQQRSGRVDIYKATEQIGHNAQTAGMYAAAGDYAMATVYQSYALAKIHNLIENMTREGRQSKASFLTKKGYGYDISGVSQDGSGPNNDQTHLWDTAEPQDGHTTPKPTPNVTVDVEAEKQFPELAEKKLNKVHFPARTD